MNLKKIVITEVVLCAIVGGLPIFLSYDFGGNQLLRKTIDGMISSAFSVNYAITLTLLYISLKFCVTRLYFKNDTTKKKINITLDVLSEVSNSILNLCRVSTGLTIGFLLLWFITERETLTYQKLIDMLQFGISGFIFIVVLSTLTNWVEKK